MDTLLGLRTWHWRATDWTAAAVAGLAAGAVLMVLDLLWSSIFNAHGPWRTSHMIAPIFLGTDTLKASGYAFSVGVVSVALATHYVLGMLFGLALAAVMDQLRLDATPGHALAAGAFLGAVLYLINFDVLPRFVFTWLATLRGGETMAAHVVFGIVAALLYRRLKRTGTEH
ncbi:MAG: hypothetical protein EOO30_02750 [Comamonadaceae bacterium]|nr:MAG: hypothetical protein EOO30_02750 [Comamonadaceae bacterium]